MKSRFSMKSRSLKLIIICALTFVFSHTNASVVTWSGSGSFTSIGSNLSGIRSVGDSVQFTASYDTSAQSFLTADSLPSFYFKHYAQDANVYIRFTSGELVWEAIGTLDRNISVAQIGYTPNRDEFYLRGGVDMELLPASEHPKWRREMDTFGWIFLVRMKTLFLDSVSHLPTKSTCPFVLESMEIFSCRAQIAHSSGSI